MKNFEWLSTIINFLLNLFKLILQIFEHLKNNHPKVLVSAIIVIILITVCTLAFMSDSFITHPQDNSNDHDPTISKPITPPNPPTNASFTFDSKAFYSKYYKDPLIVLSTLPLTLSEFSELNTRFLHFENFTFSVNEDIDNADSKVKKLLTQASNIEKDAENDYLKQKQVAELRDEAYMLCKNNKIARLAGNNYHKMFKLSQGKHNKYALSEETLQYYVRSILLSQTNTKNIAYCCKAISDTYTSLAEQEDDFAYKIALLTKAVMYSNVATHYYTEELSFSYHSVCNQEGNAYCNLLSLCKSIPSIDPNLINYFYENGTSSYERALERIGDLTPLEESQYNDNNNLLTTYYNDFAMSSK